MTFIALLQLEIQILLLKVQVLQKQLALMQIAEVQPLPAPQYIVISTGTIYSSTTYPSPFLWYAPALAPIPSNISAPDVSPIQTPNVTTPSLPTLSVRAYPVGLPLPPLTIGSTNNTLVLFGFSGNQLADANPIHVTQLTVTDTTNASPLTNISLQQGGDRLISGTATPITGGYAYTFNLASAGVGYNEIYLKVIGDVPSDATIGDHAFSIANTSDVAAGIPTTVPIVFSVSQPPTSPTLTVSQ